MKWPVYRVSVYRTVLLRMLIVLMFFTFSRLLFYFFNLGYFSDLDADSLFKAFLGGIRFDITAAIVLNAPYLLMNVLPLPFRTHRTWQRLADLFYYVFSILGLALNDMDAVYFRFTAKRMTADIFSFVSTGDEDFIELVPAFISDFFVEMLAWALLATLFVLLGSRIRVKAAGLSRGTRFYLQATFFFLLAGALSIIGIRGGFQLRPITIIDAGRYAEARNVSLVLNTPFSIIKSYGHTGLKPVHFLDDPAEMQAVFSPIHTGSGAQSMQKYNVVVIIMESFGTEYIASLNRIPGAYSYTPNLDSLIADALAFRAYANGKQSMEALPAIVAGLPSLTTRPYITSAYGSNQISSLAGILGALGYSTAFYHGGRNGTMGFESFTGIAGFERYYGKDEYASEDDFDGNWGIYDEPYFSYFKKQLDSTREPFFATIFSLSSHHPYSVPLQYKGRFSKGTLDIHESIMYADHALGGFFRSASGAPWYDSTLFVITADHTSLTYEKSYQSREGIYSIPLVFYMPARIEAGLKEDIAQQTDIMPSVLGFLGADTSYVAFGNDLFDSTAARYAVNHIDGTFQLLKWGWALQFDGKAVTGFRPMELYDGESIDEEKARADMLPFLKAYIQQYNNRLLNNNLVIRK